jgi:hypothetical protein
MCRYDWTVQNLFKIRVPLLVPKIGKDLHQNKKKSGKYLNPTKQVEKTEEMRWEQ